MTHDRLGRPIDGPCLVWTGKLPKDGYPRINRSLWPSPQLVHRVAYAIATGHPLDEIRKIPTLDHLCRTPACSAAAHLEAVGHRVNLERGNPNQNERKDFCVSGHRFTPENTYVRVSGGRQCRECKREASRESWRRKHRPDLVGKPLAAPGRPIGAVVHRDPKPRRDWADGT